MLPVSEKVKDLDFIRKGKNSCAEVTKMYGAICEIVKRKKKFVLILLLHLKLQKLWPQCISA